MTVVADKTKKPELSPKERAMLDRILGLRPTQQKRIWELVQLYQGAPSEQEAVEIGDVVAEILFRDPDTCTAAPLEDEQSKDKGKALARHRAYVGRQIRKHRQRLKMSQEKLAEKAEIPQSHVCRLETGKHAPTYLTIEKLAKAMNVKPSELDPGFND
jgi:DNA-binding XRE family transcriptional regulator